MVNERIIIFGVISDGLIAGQLSAVQSEATRGGTHDVESRAFGLFFLSFSLADSENHLCRGLSK